LRALSRKGRASRAAKRYLPLFQFVTDPAVVVWNRCVKADSHARNRTKGFFAAGVFGVIVSFGRAAGRLLLFDGIAIAYKQCSKNHGADEMQIGVETSRAVENKRIFVVDDDEIIRAALQFMLHDEYETHEVASLDNAFEKSAALKPDLLILSENVVKTAGLPVLAEIPQRIAGAKVLVVVDSLESGYGKECQSAGANGYMVKPLTVEFVRQKVDVLLGRRQGVSIPLNVL
jgi:CheY-like chemotaxis protein